MRIKKKIFSLASLLGITSIAILTFTLVNYLPKVFAAPNPGVGTAIQATGGYGKYKGGIYWLSWGRENNEQIQEGDKSVFTTPNGVKYEVTISDIQRTGLNGYTPSQSKDYLTAVYPESSSPNWAGGNNLPYAYNFDDAGGNPLQDHTGAIGINANRAEMKFRLTAKAERPNPNYGQPGQPEYIETTSNLIVAGSESLGQDFEYYSLTSPITNEDGEPTKINVLETYMTASAPYAWGDPLPRPGPLRGEPTDQQWQDRYNLQIDVNDSTIDISGSSQPARELKAHTLLTDNFHGDAMFAALNTNVINVGLSAAGGQSIAIGVLDLLDGGDAPASYEDPAEKARHSSIPRLSSESLSTGTHYLVGLEAKNNFTSADGATVEAPIPHLMRPLLRIGNFVDYETEDLNSADAQGDDNQGGIVEGSQDDEDGVNTVIAGCRGLVNVANETGDPAYLHYWVDKDSSDGFDYTDFTPNLADQEYGLVNVPANYHEGLLPGNTVVHQAKTIEVPVNDLFNPTTKQTRLMRFRISYNDHLKHSGTDLGGEIEDAFVTFLNPRPEATSATATCNATHPLKVVELPTTGWTLTLQQKQANGTYTNYGAPVSGNTDETTLDLPFGEYKIIAGSFDGIAPATCQKEVEVIIDDDCVAPVANDDSDTTSMNTPVEVDVIANDTADDDLTIDGSTIEITSNGGHGTCTVTSGKITYTPDPGYHGTDSCKYTVKDSKGVVTNEATLTVTITNNPPVLTTTNAEIMVGDPLDLTTLATATDVEDDDAILTGNIVIIDDGGFDNNAPGIYTVTYQVTDSHGNTVTETADVKVSGANVFDPPSARKTVTNTAPEMEWKMVWINDGNIAALNTQVLDPIPAGTTYVDGSVMCDARGTSTTSVCTYDVAENRIRWEGNIDYDIGGTDEDDSANEVVITFKTTVPPEVDKVENQAQAYYDKDKDGDFGNDKNGGLTPVLTDNFNATNSTIDPTVWSRQNVTKPNTGLGQGFDWKVIVGIAAVIVLAIVGFIYGSKKSKK